MTDDFIRQSDGMGVNPDIDPEDVGKALDLLLRGELTLLVDHFTVAKAIASAGNEEDLQVPVVVLAIQGEAPLSSEKRVVRLVMPFYMAERLGEGLVNIQQPNPHD